MQTENFFEGCLIKIKDNDEPGIKNTLQVQIWRYDTQ